MTEITFESMGAYHDEQDVYEKYLGKLKIIQNPHHINRYQFGVLAYVDKKTRAKIKDLPFGIFEIVLGYLEDELKRRGIKVA